MREVKKLYRKENKKALGYRGDKGGDYKHIRNSKEMKEFEGNAKSMKTNVERGLDYTPLFKFLLSKVGQPWDDVYSEAISRLDKKDPIFFMVDLNPIIHNELYSYVFRHGESSYYSKLTVDEQGILVKLNPDIAKDMLKVMCTCCTHTFNGEVFS